VFRTQSNDNEKAMSIEDRRFLEIMQRSIKRNEQRNWETSLPLREVNPIFPNNRVQAVERLNKFIQSFKRNPKLENDYVDFIGGMLQRGHAIPVPLESLG
jgi:hypothetical protein